MKVALAQMNQSFDLKMNEQAVLRLIGEAAGQGAKLICFPECALTGYPLRGITPESISLDSLTIKSIQERALQLDLEVYIGATLAVDGKLINSYLRIFDSISFYAKTHLGTREIEVYHAGESIECLESRLGPVGVAICLESHFPEIATRCRALGAVAMFFPFASPSVCGSREEIWKKILPARAYDNGLYVFGINLAGSTDHREFSGGMMAVDPKGNVIDAYFGDGEHVMTVEMDMEELAKLRRPKGKVNYFARRKPELYT